jgi:hypothetical protein
MNVGDTLCCESIYLIILVNSNTILFLLISITYTSLRQPNSLLIFKDLSSLRTYGTGSKENTVLKNYVFVIV